MRVHVVLGALTVSVLSSAALADTAPIGPGDPTWAIRSVLGYTKTGGNTDNSAGNLLFHAAHLMGDWKLLFGGDGLYGSTRGETTAQAWEAYLQGNYHITPRFYWYLGGRYVDNRFSGFAYQAALKSGLGYKFIDTDDTKLTAQAGGGYRWLRTEIIVKDDIGGVVSRTEQPGQSDAIFDAGLAFEHDFNQATKLLAAAAVLSGKLNTCTTASVALHVKMSDRLALAAAYKLTDNSNPPPGSGRRDTLTTLGLVYELKNEKLPPE
jgi:putative salt-induced outer membrane protein YdiY